MAAVRCSLACLLVLVYSLLLSSAPAEAGCRKIIVGGNAHWVFGFNYSDWAAKTAPFYVGDVLVFIYKDSYFNGMPVVHDVLRLHSYKNYEACTFGKAVLLANTTEGVPGFEYKLTKKGNYYFACGIGDGVHCSTGLMKFEVQAM